MTLDRRKLLTFLTGGLAGIGATVAALPFIASMNKSKHIKVPFYHKKINFPKLKPGQMMTIPTATGTLYVVKRTPEQIVELSKNNEDLLDPASEKSEQPEFALNNLRSSRSDIFLSWGRCTHLGCNTSHVSPKDAEHFMHVNFQAGAGFHCPCHGSMFDSAGRVYKNMPAKRNLDIPNYEFLDDSTIRILDKTVF